MIDAYRGRVLGFYGLTGGGSREFGGMQAGFLAEWTTAPFAIQTGAVVLAVIWVSVEGRGGSSGKAGLIPLACSQAAREKIEIKKILVPLTKTSRSSALGELAVYDNLCHFTGAAERVIRNIRESSPRSPDSR